VTGEKRVFEALQAHPLLALGSFLLLEALLPVPLQPTAWAARGAIRVYQATLGPILPTQCLYTPTCSQYGLESVRKYGTVRGGALTVWRLLRCNPFARGGHDPVP
jgi:hypothetical protein